MNEEKIRLKYNKITEILISRNLSITTMESITSGQIASLITDTPGASAILKGAFVTYSNEAKIHCGVPKEVIDEYTVYSKETADNMALGCQRTYNSDIAIGVTGTSGNVDPNNSLNSNPGEVYYTIYFKGTMNSYKLNLPPIESRFGYKMEVADRIADSLIDLLNES